MNKLVFCILLASCASTRSQKENAASKGANNDSSHLALAVPFEGAEERLDGSTLQAEMKASPVAAGKLNGASFELTSVDRGAQFVEWEACSVANPASCVRGATCSQVQENYAMPAGDVQVSYRACRHPDFATSDKRCGPSKKLHVRIDANSAKAHMLAKKMEELSQQIKDKSEKVRQHIGEFKNTYTPSTDPKQESADNMLLNQLGFNPCVLGQLYSDPIYDDLKKQVAQKSTDLAKQEGLHLSEGADTTGRLLFAVGAIGLTLTAAGYYVRDNATAWESTLANFTERTHTFTTRTAGRGSFWRFYQQGSIGQRVQKIASDAGKTIHRKVVVAQPKTYAGAAIGFGVTTAVGIITWAIGSSNLAESPQQKAMGALAFVEKEIDALRSEREKLLEEIQPALVGE